MLKKFSPIVSLLFVLFACCALAAQSPATAAKRPDILTVDQVKPGMRGHALTVFSGTKPEPMEVEVLGVMKNMLGPKKNLILVRLHGEKVEHTGVVAGMSGSPVYLDGKLAGALAYRIGVFSKEPIAGVTPIADMFDINELDASTPPEATSTKPAPPAATATSTTATDRLQNYASLMTPIGAPLVFTGFSEETLKRFGSYFESAGVIPVIGAGSVDPDVSQPEPIEPGSSVGALLIRGDMNIAATCTVTYFDVDRLLACGHPLLQFGKIDLPMTKSNVVATLPSPLNAFKIASSTEQIGAFVQDRHTGILGRFGKEPRLIPVSLTIHSPRGPKAYKFEVLNNPKLTPVAVMTTVFNALQTLNENGDDVSYRMSGRISVDGYTDVSLNNLYAPTDMAPTSFLAAIGLGERFGRIYSNPYQAPQVKGVTLDFDVLNERRAATLESVRTDVSEARPGDLITVEAVLRPYRGERIVRQLPIRIPSSAPKGTLRILVSDADTLDRARRMNPAVRRLELAATIALLNKERQNDRLYVSVLEPNPQAQVEDKVMPGLPLSVINVMDGARASRDMTLAGESSVDESSTPVEYVVSGAQVLTLTIK